MLQLSDLKGIGPAVLKKMADLSIFSPQDLLFHLPYQYEDRTKLIPLTHLQDKQMALIEAVVIETRVIFKPKRRLEILLSQNNVRVRFMLFHWHPAIQKMYQPGVRVRAFGIARRFGTQLSMVHPEMQIIKEAIPLPVHTTLTPVYPTTQGVTQRTLRQAITEALQRLDEIDIKDLNENDSSISVQEALRIIHAPPKGENINALINRTHPAFVRFIEEELLAHQLSFLKVKQDLKREKAHALAENPTVFDALKKQLGFQLTEAQARVVKEIVDDLKKPVPMLRLIQGEVGSGKTAVAAFAAAMTIANGAQVAIMAPTDLLAQQHFEKFSSWFFKKDEPNRVVLLSGKLRAKEKRAVSDLIESGEAKIIIGTHALFQKSVVFSNLVLAIIDEQHRFGVMQRAALLNKSAETLRAHQLIMTATPIPRTLALTLYAKLDISVIDHLPPGRMPIETVAVPVGRDLELMQRLQERAKKGEQAYWVCTLIEENETLTEKAAIIRYEKLKQSLPQLRIALLHGKMSKEEKLQIMQAFKEKSTDVLIATTVIEVGIDVPNATLMVIENAENLGLAQLHQLRGRVGRGTKQSHCVLLYEGPLSLHAKERLEAMRTTQDGFVLAEKDLMLRGPGELLGERQAGSVNFKIADLSRDLHLLPTIRTKAEALIARNDPVVDLLLARWFSQAEALGAVG